MNLDCRLGLGTVGFSDRNRADSVLGYYFETGGSIVDTAPAYDQGDALPVVGRWLADHPDCLERAQLVGKVGHPPADHPDRLAGDLDQSFDALPRVDMVLVHRDNVGYPVTAWAEAVVALRARCPVGVSNWACDRVDALNAVLVDGGQVPVTVVSNNLSLARWSGPPWPGVRTAKDDLDWFERRGLTLLAWSSSACGFFARGGAVDPMFEATWVTADNRERLARVETLAGRLGVSPQTVAVAWVLNAYRRAVPLVGAQTVDELREALSAFNLALSDQTCLWLDLGASD